MIKYLSNSDIDKQKWDKCIRDAFNGNVYAWSWYLDIVHQNWEALVEDDYERVFPLTGNSRLGIFYLFQPFFAQQLGIFSKNILSPDIVSRFIDAIPAKYRLVEIRLNTHNRISNVPMHVESHLNHELDLIPNYEKLSRAYHKNTKRNLTKARDAGLTIMKNLKPEEIVGLFRSNRGRTISHWNTREYNRLIKLVYAGIYRGQTKLYGAYTNDNQICGGAIFFKSHEKITFLFSGVNETGRNNHALTFILDHVIREFAGGPFVLDFEGSDNPNLARFYKGFGSIETTYPGIYINRLPWPLRLTLKLLHLRKRL